MKPTDLYFQRGWREDLKDETDSNNDSTVTALKLPPPPPPPLLLLLLLLTLAHIKIVPVKVNQQGHLVRGGCWHQWDESNWGTFFQVIFQQPSSGGVIVILEFLADSSDMLLSQ